MICMAKVSFLPFLLVEPLPYSFKPGVWAISGGSMMRGITTWVAGFNGIFSMIRGLRCG
jgi:hypothetical protein